MKLVKIFFIFGLVVCSGLAGCKPQGDSSPQIENAEKRQAKLVMNSPKTMDFTATQKTIKHWPASETDMFHIQAVTGTESIERGHVRFDKVIQVNGKKLELRGTAIRKFEMSTISLLTIYTVAFYAPAGADFSSDVQDTEQALILEYHLDVPKEKVVQAIKENVYSNPKVKAEAVEAYFNQLSDAFDSPKKGSRYDFVYIPGRGTAMIKERNVMTLIPTFDFAQAFFGIWLSPHGTDLQMRCEILALPCPPKSNLNPVNLISNNLGEAKEKLGKLKKLIP